MAAVALLASTFFAPIKTHAAYDLEIPANPWDEYRMQFRKYSQQLLKSFDRAFVDDYPGAIAEASKAIEILPDEGLAYAERAKYNRILNYSREADRDFRKALSLFDQAIERYSPGNARKKGAKGARKVDPAEAARLVTALHYQRGEAFFGFEQYRQAADDFALACQGGSALACSRMWEVKMVQKRGVNWVPLSSRQFYDRQRIDRAAKDIVRVWVRREDAQPAQTDGPESSVQQHIELKCTTRESRIVEAMIVSAAGGKTPVEPETHFGVPTPGSSASKLLVMLCGPQTVK